MNQIIARISCKCDFKPVPSREGGGRRGNYPGARPGGARKKFSLGRYIIHYNTYHKLTAGAQQNLGKLIIALKLSGPSLVLEII